MTKLRIPLLIAALCAAAAVPLLILPAGAQQSDRAKQVGGKFLCMCGCSQILTQCNHVGCTVSASMLKKLDQVIARGDSDDLIIQSFIQEFGTAVFAEPPKKGFSRVAWFIPGVTLGLGLALVIVVIRRWRLRPVAVPAGPAGGKAVAPELLERARQRADRETED